MLAAPTTGRRRSGFLLSGGAAAALLLLLAFAASACDEGGSGAGTASDPCAEALTALPGFCDEGAAAWQRWDPGAGDFAGPDDLFTVADPSTGTGLRVATDPAQNPALAATVPESFHETFRSFASLDGFGTQAGIILRLDFEGAGAIDADALPQGEETLAASSPILVAILPEGAPPQRVAVRVRLTDEGQTLILEPLVPLPERTRIVALARRDLPLVGGGCLAPSLPLQRQLTGASCGGPGEQHAHKLLAEATSALLEVGHLEAVHDVGALVTFTTQSVFEFSVAVAEQISTHAVDFSSAPSCESQEKWVHCEATFPGVDYRDPDGVIRQASPSSGATPQIKARYELPVEFWLPKAGGDYEFGGPPYPTVVFGHGLGSGADGLGAALARFAAPRGMVTLAIPAVRHPGHPAGAQEGKLLVAAEFFGLDAMTLGFRPLVLRDNWRQSTYDKLQLLRLLEQGIDVDGDGTPDTDPARTVYVGASLGAIMGPELLALTPAFGAGVLIVGGARVSDIVYDGPMFSGLIDLLRPRDVSDGDVDRFFPTMQALIERGDSGNWATRVLRDRLAPGGPDAPDLLVGMAMGDEIVPNSTNEHLARALGIPHVPPVLHAPGVISESAAPPLRGNGPGGVTAGFFEFDIIDDGEGGTEPASHDGLPSSEVGATMWMHFISAWMRDGEAEIIDPYKALGLK